MLLTVRTQLRKVGLPDMYFQIDLTSPSVDRMPPFDAVVSAFSSSVRNLLDEICNVKSVSKINSCADGELDDVDVVVSKS